MSGGEFDYLQFKINDCAIGVDQIIDKSIYSELTISRMRECAETLIKAAEMLHRVDWLVSGDDGEESFNQRWGEKL